MIKKYFFNDCFSDVKETEKSHEMLQKNVTFMQNELIRMK